MKWAAHGSSIQLPNAGHSMQYGPLFYNEMPCRRRSRKQKMPVLAQMSAHQPQKVVKKAWRPVHASAAQLGDLFTPHSLSHIPGLGHSLSNRNSPVLENASSSALNASSVRGAPSAPAPRSQSGPPRCPSAHPRPTRPQATWPREDPGQCGGHSSRLPSGSPVGGWGA